MTKKKKPAVVPRTTGNKSGVPIRDALHHEFYESIAEVLRTSRAKAYQAVNFTMVEAYWNIGRMIVEEEQQGKERAEYGAFLIQNLAIRLANEFGRGFSEPSLWNMRQYYQCFPILSALRRELTWTHVGIILCTEKDHTVVKYSVLNESRQLFASKYMLYLPTEEALRQELERERALVVREQQVQYRREEIWQH